MQPYKPEELDIDPQTMAAFLGQTAKGLAQIDSAIIERSDNLSQKKMLFEQTARQAMQTAITKTPPRIMPQETMISMENIDHIIPQNSIPLIPLPDNVSQNVPYIDKGRNIPNINNDPNQLEFDFNNSVTAITINNNIAELKKKVLDLDKKIQMMIDCFNEVAGIE